MPVTEVLDGQAKVLDPRSEVVAQYLVPVSRHQGRAVAGHIIGCRVFRRHAAMMHAGAMRAEIFLPSTYESGVPYEEFRRLRATDPVCWIDEPPVGPWPGGPGHW